MSSNEVIVTISDLSRGGSGVAREPSGRVIFVPLTAPGDRVHARIVEEDKRFAQAELVEVLEPSPDRVAARCAVFGRCGGCAWQHIPYARQWKTKLEGARHALKRVGIDAGAIEEFPAEDPWSYRNRVQLRGQGAMLGFYARKSHEIVAIERCEIADERINAELAAARAEGAKLPREYKVEIETLPEGGTLKSWNAPHAAAGFRQVNEPQNARMREWVRARVAEQADKPVLYDLFGGSGNLSLPLLDLVSEVHCVDVTAPADRSTDKIRFHRSAVAPWLKRMTHMHNQKVRPHFWLLDPPRSGLDKDLATIAEGMQKLGANRLVAVGCDPDAWARDLAGLVKRGWKIDQLACFDFFPQTPHVESVAYLRS